MKRRPMWLLQSTVVVGAAAILFVAVASGRTSDSALPQVNGCGGPARHWAVQQASGGPPPELQMLRCVVVPGGASILVSPDAHSLAVATVDGRLQVGSLSRFSRLHPVGPARGAKSGGDARTEALTSPRFGFGGAPPVRWSKSSRFVYGVRASEASEDGESRTRLRPVRIRRDGRMEDLPVLVFRSTPPDAVYWVDGEGIALARFTPRVIDGREASAGGAVIAVVDVERGVVIDVIGADALAPKGDDGRIHGDASVILDAAASVTADRRVEAVLRATRSEWRIWRQGRGLEAADFGHAGGRPGVVMTPDGRGLLLTTGLQPGGPICEYHSKCPPPTPRQGVLAVLRDLSDGKVIWETTGTVSNSENWPQPAISPDGRSALIGTPSEKGEDNSRVALVSLKTGAVLRTWPVLWNSAYTVGFADGGRKAWIAAGGAVAVYRVPSRRN